MIELPSENVTEEQLRRFENRRNRRNRKNRRTSAKTSAFHETLINLATARHDLIVDAEPCQSCNISAADLIQLENELVADGFPSLGIRESLGLPKDFDPMKLPPPVHPLPLSGYPLLENSTTQPKASASEYGSFSASTFDKWWRKQPDYIKNEANEYMSFVSSNILNKSAIPPMWQLLMTTGSWNKGEPYQPYVTPSRDLWQFAPRSFELFWELKQRGIINKNAAIISAYRTPGVNRAVGGAQGSAHTKAGAFDISNYKIDGATDGKLVKFWQDEGKALKMGLGFYGGGTIHIDTFAIGHRWWDGRDYSANGKNITSWASPVAYGGMPAGTQPTPRTPVGSAGGSPVSTDGVNGGTSVSTTARKPTNTGAPSVCKNLPVDAKVKEAFELAFKQLYPEGKVDFGPVPTSQPPLGQYTPPPASPGSPGYSQVPPTAGGAGNTSTGQPGKHKLSVGDSFSEGARDFMPGVTKHYGKWGKNPEYILKNFVKKIPDDILNGAEVFLSTGTANAMGNTGMRDEITAQIQYMFDKGACSITVAGVYPESKTSAGVDKAGSAKSNQMVKEIVDKFASKGKRIRWTGPVDAKYIGSDKLHPTAAWYKLPEVAFRGC